MIGGLRGRAARLVPRTLRARLIAGLLVLLVVTCAAVGLATTAALRHFLVDRLDQQLADAGGRYAASLEHAGQGGDTRAQAPGTFGARLLNGRVTAAAVVDGDADDADDPNDDDRVALSPAGAACSRRPPGRRAGPHRRPGRFHRPLPGARRRRPGR